MTLFILGIFKNKLEKYSFNNLILIIFLFIHIFIKNIDPLKLCNFEIGFASKSLLISVIYTQIISPR